MSEIGAGFSESMVEADGFRVRYREKGTGKAVVTLHGAGGLRLSGMHDILAQKYRVIAIEAPGFGESAVNTRSGHMSELAKSVLAVTAALKLDSFHLIGTSFGARLGAWMAVTQPEKFKNLVLLAPATIRLAPVPVAKTPEEAQLLMYAHPERQPPRSARGITPEVNAKQTALVAKLLDKPRDAALEEKLRTMRIPTLAIFGTKDRVAPTEAAHLYREIIPNCHIVFVYDTAHQIDAERPEAVASVIGDFLERQEKFLVNRVSGLIEP